MIQNVLVDTNTESTVDLTQIPEPVLEDVQAIYLNEGDHIYAKVGLDFKSIEWFKDNIFSIKDPLPRYSIKRDIEISYKYSTKGCLH